MRRWNSYIEIIYFPLEVLYISTLLLGVTGLILSRNFQVFFSLNQPILLRLVDMIRYLSAMLIRYFPVLFLLRGVYRRNEDGMIVIAGLLGYVAFHIGTVFFAPTNLIAEVYGSVLGIQASSNMLYTLSSGVLNSLQTGIFGALAVLLITRLCAGWLKKRSPYGVLGFVDKNVSIVFDTLFLSLIAGIMAAFIFPLIINGAQQFFVFISTDLNNPVNLFFYGIVDRLFSIFGLSEWLHNQFWFNSLGGSWSDALGSIYLGDVSIWNGQLAKDIYGFGAGKLITPYYILNIFAVPAFILASYQTYTDKIVRKRMRVFVGFSLLASAMFGTLLPIEIFLLFTTPLLFIFHLAYTGLLFAVLNAIGVAIGYTFTGSVAIATPGTLLDLLILIRNPFFQKSLAILLFIGLMSALLYYALGTYYYRKGAINLIIPNEREVLIQELLDSIGGLDNIKLINASVGKLIVQVKDREGVDFSKIHHRVSKIVDTRAGYALTYGSSSYMIWSKINLMLSQSKPEQSA